MMHASTLRIIMKVRGLNQSAVSKIAGVSRQAVSLWFISQSDFQNIQIRPLIKLSRSLNISIDDLTQPMPLLSDQNLRMMLYVEFCWDSLYPDIEAFFIALARYQLPAMARLVACLGMFESAYILGDRVWVDYSKYRQYIHPARRKECDHIWKFRPNRILN